jgi:hypothetical protein
MKFRIRFNQSRGQPGRGTVDHVWRVFDETGKETICKNIVINTRSWGERDGDNWNICCEGEIEIERATSTVYIQRLGGAVCQSR